MGVTRCVIFRIELRSPYSQEFFADPVGSHKLPTLFGPPGSFSNYLSIKAPSINRLDSGFNDVRVQEDF